MHIRYILIVLVLITSCPWADTRTLKPARSFQLSFWYTIHLLHQLKTACYVLNHSYRFASAFLNYPAHHGAGTSTQKNSGAIQITRPSRSPGTTNTDPKASQARQHHATIVNNSKKPPDDDKEEQPDTHYFLPQNDLKKILEELTDELEKSDRTIILSFDIDGTLFHRPERLKSVDKLDIFRAEQRQSLSMIAQWLSGLGRSSRLLLIYNSIRDAANDPFWEIAFNAQGLPSPHILISNGGAAIALAESLPAFLSGLKSQQQLAEQLQKPSRCLQEHAEKVQQAFKRLSVSDIYKRNARSQKRLREWDTHTIGLSCEGYHYLEFHYMFVARDPSTYKFMYTLRGWKSFFFFDRTINKGGTLIYLIDIIKPYIQGSEVMIFTAGDTLPDLPMLRLDRLGQAFSTCPDSDLAERIASDMAPLGVEFQDIETIQKQWRRGFIPREYEDGGILQALPDLNLKIGTAILTCQYWGFEGLLHRVLQELKSQ